MSSLSPSLHHSLTIKFFIFSFIDSPSHLFSLHIFIPFLSLFTVPHLSILQSPLPHSSPRQMVSVSLGWLQNQRCNSFSFFFSIAPSLPLSLPSLILVSSHCGAFNSSNHMVAESSWRCREAFIGASKHSCNNARQGSEFFITLMLDRADPSIPPGSPTAPTQTHSTPFPFS